ncbi:MAG: MucBP domain-containing protein [Clostridia bacterium]|nr:MucBP domain-containing protein [Clostridia bacterium]
MKIIEKVLKNKLASFGFDVERVSNQLNQIDFALIENQIALESEAEKYIIVRRYTEPTAEISRMLINYNKYYIQNLIVSGDINFSTTNTSIGTVFPVVDYKFSDSICIIATTIALNVEILIYSPSETTKMQYGYQTYEGLVAQERNNITKEYYEAFVENGRVHENKVKSIMSLLLAEHIIDEMTISDENPKIKMYDNPDSYAENITEYKIKYINRRTNRIELAYRQTNIKRLGANVLAGMINNDPYIKLENLPKVADFPLNMISCYWTSASKGKKDEVSIYIATKDFGEVKTYREYCEKNSKKYDTLLRNLQIQFERETGKTISNEYLIEILNKLNQELLNPSMSIIRDCMNNPSDEIEVLKYRFKATTDQKEFEEKLYISIEDNIGTRYKYKLPENILSDLTRVGNKLEYTDQNGKQVRKQSVADFNVNSKAAIIRRETLIDYSNIPDLLGYIYEDMEYLGTDMLPVPSIEVDFYFPAFEKNEVSMYNGTNYGVDYSSLNSFNKFNSMEESSNSTVPGTTYATVRYVNSSGEVLKENTVNNLYAGTSYVPEIIPIISDSEGREWVCGMTQFPSTVINMVPEYNIIEIKYKEKYSKVNITFLNRDGKKICDDVIETVQTGTTYDLSSKKHYLDESSNEWQLISSRPQKFVVKDDDYSNNLILIYDIQKETVSVKLLNPSREEIAKQQLLEYPIGKVVNISLDKIVIDEKGKGWIYNGVNPIQYMVKNDGNNVLEVSYEEYKLPVIVKYQTEDGISILNDKLEYIQVGMPYDAPYEKEVNDIKLRVWQYREGASQNFITSQNESDNVIKIIYEPKLANVSIQMVNETGNNLLNPIQKSCQIGEEFSSVFMNEIIDNFGRMWIKKEDPLKLVVSENDLENNIIIKYQPLMGTITVNFFDDERNELIPSKSFVKQVGTIFKPEIIEKLESEDGRKWRVSSEELEELVVKKNIEENIISVFYEKELADVILEFVDKYGKKVKEPVTVKGQIGSDYNPKAYDVIEDLTGGKLMLESTEPKKLIVKNSGTRFKLTYGEIKAIVIVKHINIKTNKTIMDDVIAKVKLGGVYIPNIQEKIYDKEKCMWKFIGDKNISIIVKENEQENIILLQYDEATAKVSIKYQDSYGNTLRDDVVYDLQIGKDIDIKKLDHFIDSNGIGWEFDSTKSSSRKVVEGENDIVNIYNPLKVDVKVRYLNEEGQEIIDNKVNQVQIGRRYEITYDEKVTSKNNLLWRYKEGADDYIKVEEAGNIIDIIYEPVYTNIIERFYSKSGEVITEEVKKRTQVGSIVEFTPENILVDSESKKWNFVKIDRKRINVLENEEQNIVNEIYEERKAEIMVKIFNSNDEEIVEPKKYSAQVGSKFKAELPNSFIDSKTKLGWQLSKTANDTIVVDEDSGKNTIIVKYDKYLVSVKNRIVDTSGNSIFPDEEKQLQVGTTYSPTVEKELKDDEGKIWFYGKKREKGLLLFDDKTENEDITITVSENSENNIVLLKYAPMLAKVTVKYQDNLGNIIAQADEYEAQIGSNYTPSIKEIIKDVKNNKWMYNPNSKSTILVDKNEGNNVILLSYEEEKAPVIYKYQDEFKNRLRSPKKQLAQIGSIYTPEIDNIIEDEQGKVWEYKSSNVEKLEIKDSGQENVVEVTYVPLLTEVELNIKNRKGELITTQVEKAQLGSNFSPNIDEKIFDDNSMMFRFVECKPKELLVKEVPIGASEKLNVFELTYEAVYSNVTIVYQDIDGNKLKDDEIVQLQVGTKYTPKLIQYVTDRRGIQWENISKEVDTIRVMENPKDNMIKMTYELAKAEVIIRYKDLDGNTIKEANRFQENIGVEFVPECDEIIVDGKNRKWLFVSSDPVKLTVGSINNIINLTYQEKKVPVVIKFETVDGKKLRADAKENVQVGSQYTPKKNFAIIYDENEIWRFLEFRPSSILVTDNSSDNIIIQVYDNKVSETPKNPKLVNPFADTLTNEEKEDKTLERVITSTLNSDLSQKQEVSNLILEKNEDANINRLESVENEFKEPNLINLSKSILLDDTEKTTIIKLNDINKKIINELNNFKNSFDFNMQDELVRKINEYMSYEKEIIQNELSDMLSNDKTGKRFLKILEAIVELDKDYQKMQERKVILLTDYFVNTSITNNEQAIYICERAKNTQELLIVQNKINSNAKNMQELQKYYIDLLYEKAMFDSYYKTRTKAKDDYFINQDDRASIGSEIAVLINNMLPKQAFNLLQKNSLNIVQQSELEAIMKLLSSQQRELLVKMVSEIKDGKIRKELTKRLKDI